MSNRTRPNGASPRGRRPQPPSLRPPSSLDLARRQESHEVFVQIANLQMARTRQERIRRALSGQVDRCTREIQRIDAKVEALCRKVGLRPDDAEASEPRADDGDEEDGFAYEY